METVKKRRIRRREGFSGQRLTVVPSATVERARNDPLLKGLLCCAAGWFPRVPGHFVERKAPLQEGILILCLMGSGWVQTASHPRRRVEPGNAVLIPPGVPHLYAADLSDPWSIAWAHFIGAEMEPIFLRLGVTEERPLLRLPEGAVEKFQYDRIYARLAEDDTFPNLLSASAELRLMFSEMCRLRLRGPSRSTEDPIGRTVEWMQENWGARTSLNKLARIAALSPSHYSTLFRKRFGYSPIDYFLRLKIRRACELLDYSDRTIQEIAESAGYEDAFYFSRLFHGIMGRSPRKYRATPKT